MQAKASEPTVYYSCDDNFNEADRTTDTDQGFRYSQDQSPKSDNVENSSGDSTPNSEGICPLIILRLLSLL